MKSIHKSQTFIQMSKFVQSCLNFSKILQTFKLQPFFFNCLNLPVAIEASVGLRSLVNHTVAGVIVSPARLYYDFVGVHEFSSS